MLSGAGPVRLRLTRCRGWAGELGAVELSVEAVLGQQFPVRSALADCPGVNDQDLVRFADGGESMRDHQGGPSGERRLERPLDGQL